MPAIQIYSIENYFILIAIILGLCVGSFLNVCIYRIPKRGTLMGRSHCPHCDHQIRWYENIPVFSYLFLLGKCAQCRHTISPRYPLVELITTVFSVAVMCKTQYQPLPYFLWFLGFFCPLIVVTFIDLELQIIPDIVSLPGILAGVIIIQVLNYPLWQSSLIFSGIGFLVGGGFFFVLASLFFLIKKKEGLGGGDIKLSAMLGTFIGWQGMMFTILISSVSAVFASLIIFIVTRRAESARILPYGPFLAMGAFLYFFCGEQIIQWYLGLILPPR